MIFEDSTYSSRRHLYFHRRNSYGKKDHGKKDQTDGALMMAAYKESEYEKEILALEGSETLAEAEVYAEPEDKNTLSVSTITLGKETKVRSVKMRHHIMNCQLRVLVG